MKVLLTGGVGDLGQALIPSLLENGDIPVILDIRAPLNLKREVTFFHGSVLDRSRLKEYFHGCDCIVHIAAWHGIHEARGAKKAYDFFDLNVRVIPLFGAPGSPTRCNLPGMNMTAADLALSMTPGMMGIITPYATGPGPIYAVSGYLPAGDFCGWERPTPPSA
jgi:hypothetical protein